MIMGIKIIHITQSLGGVQTYIESVLNYSNYDNTTYILIGPEDDTFCLFCKNKNVTYYPVKFKRNISLLTDLLALIKLFLY